LAGLTRIYLGVYWAELATPWAKSLKEKRALIKPVTEKLKARFPVSVARLDGLDAHDWETIGAVAISSDAVWLEALLNDVHDFVLRHGDFRVERSSIRVEVWNGGLESAF
jgi:uncharacterized protein YlxP (DUF503 family)